MLERWRGNLFPGPAVGIFRRGVLSDVAVSVGHTAVRVGVVASALHCDDVLYNKFKDDVRVDISGGGTDADGSHRAAAR